MRLSSFSSIAGGGAEAPEMKDARRGPKGLGQVGVVGSLGDLGWALPSEATSARIGTLAVVVGGVLSLVILAL